jgi:tetratricopeptide (TPR) repeat protein
MPLHTWWLTQTHILWIYLKLAVWPSPLMIHYMLPYLTTVTDAFLYVVPTFVLGVVTLLLLWRNSPIGFLGAWIFTILSPTSLVPIPSEIAAERRMYLPLAALAALFVVGGFRAIQSLLQRTSIARSATLKPRIPQRAIVVAMLLIVIACGIASAHRLTNYRDEIDLWRQVATFEPQDYIARDTLGHLLVISGNVPEAVDEFQAALALKPDYPDALNNLGHAFLVSERVPEAVEKFQAALALEPKFGLAHNNLGVAFRLLGHLPESVEQLEQARKLQPDFYPARINLGRSLLMSGRLPEAVDELQAAWALKPDSLAAISNLALAYSQMGQFGEATKYFELVLHEQPESTEAHNRLADVLRQAGQPAPAIEHYRAVLRLDPNDLHAQVSLAQTLALVDQSAEAIATAEKAIELGRSTGQEATAEQLEEWLKHYRVELQRNSVRLPMP